MSAATVSGHYDAAMTTLSELAEYVYGPDVISKAQYSRSEANTLRSGKYRRTPGSYLNPRSRGYMRRDQIFERQGEIYGQQQRGQRNGMKRGAPIGAGAGAALGAGLAGSRAGLRAVPYGLVTGALAGGFAGTGIGAAVGGAKGSAEASRRQLKRNDFVYYNRRSGKKARDIGAIGLKY